MSLKRTMVVVALGISGLAITANATEETWSVSSGNTRFALNVAELEQLGVSVALQTQTATFAPDISQAWPIIWSDLVVTSDHGQVTGFSGLINHSVSIVLSSGGTNVRLTGFSTNVQVSDAGMVISIVDAVDGKTSLVRPLDSKVGFDRDARQVMIESAGLGITEVLATRLGRPDLVGNSLGDMAMVVKVVPDGPAGESDDAEGNVAGGNNGTVCGGEGPDVIVGDLSDVANYNAVGNIEAFAVGTTSCNIGNENLSWIAGNNQHPVIGQSMYRLKNGRFEHIGQSWLKHGFTALTMNLCGCGCNGVGGSQLGVGCSDPYGGGLNGSQSGLGPKSEVNAHTGFFIYPHDSSSGNSIYKRVQVRISDIDPALNPGATYFVEGHYVAPDDAEAANQDNNASYRRITITGGGTAWNATVTATTQREQPAIRAWQDNDATVVETDIRVPGEGLMILAAKVTDLGNGFWHYEYALQNLNSDRCAGSITIPISQSSIVDNIGFHDVDYHSGEPYALEDWSNTFENNTLRWNTKTYIEDPNANALRWGTMYNFRFDANIGPAFVPGEVVIGMFKPGGPASITVTTLVPDPTAGDCNFNLLPDYCDVSCDAGQGGECNLPGCGASFDCNANGAPDECESHHDCNGNHVPDSCDLAGGADDCDSNNLPDECDPNHDGDASPDACDGDIDNDGLVNGSDACDFTPLGAPVRANGAQIGDINADCDIDLFDFGHLNTCLETGGPNPPSESSGCRNLYDHNLDTQIDLNDVGYFMNAFSGSIE